MRLDDLAPRAGREAREATRHVQPPSIKQVRDRKRRRGAVATVLTVFAATLVAVGTMALRPAGGGADAVAPPQTTPATSASAGETFAGEFRLLDGRSATVGAGSNLSLQSYTFFVDTADFFGEGHVTAVFSDPHDLAASLTAMHEATLSDVASLWRSEQLPEQPLFLSVDLGDWIVWLAVGITTNHPGTGALTQLAEKLTGTTDDLGVTLSDIELDYQELHLSSGRADEVVTLRVGTCFEEPAGLGSTVDDSRWGTVTRSDGRASWCIVDTPLQVEVLGPPAFVDLIVSSITVTVSDSPLTDSTTPTQAAEPLFGEPIDLVLVFDDGIDGVLAVDPDARVATRSVVDGQRAGDQPYRLTIVDDQLVVGSDRVYAADIATRESTLLGNATVYVPAVEPGLVWLLDYPSGRIQGRPSAWQATVAGGQVTEPKLVDIDGFPAIGVPGGLAVETDGGIALWDAVSGTVTRRLGNGPGFVSDASGPLLAWCVEDCAELHITNVATTRDDLVIQVPDAETGSSALRFRARDARFSPDGTSLAAIAGDSLVLIDTETGDADVAAQLPTSEPGYFLGWSPDGAQLFVSSFSYQQPTTDLVRYDLRDGAADQIRLPFGGALSFVVIDKDAARPYLRDQDQDPTACPQVRAQPSGRTGLCGFRF